ncbi:nitrogen regulatory protein P-II [Clostridia bacterium]|nr:nitrogen regulatory protein P-II [Clostridia bacterium]
MEDCSKPIPRRIKVLMTIVTRELGDRVKEICDEKCPAFHLSFVGNGTAPTKFLDYLSISDSERDVVFSFVPADLTAALMNKLHDELKLDKHGSGISFSIPISSVGGHKTHYVLSGGDNKIEDSDKEITVMNEQNKHVLIITVVDSGFSDIAMDAARAAGARGGTIINGRGPIGEEGSKRFFGLTINPDKEIVLVLADTETRAPIMTAICDAAGMSTKAHGISLSLPVDEVRGLSPKAAE